MKEDRISSRQLMVLLWGALLAPAAELLPAVTVGPGGRGAWLGALWAAPLLAGLGLALWRLCRAGGGMAGGLQRAFGPLVGKGVLLLYMVWGLGLLCLRLRLSAQRLMSAGYRDGALWALLPVVAGLALWMAWGKLSAFARTGEIFFGALSVTLVLVVGLSLTRVRPALLLPLWTQEVVGGVRALPATAGVLGYGIYACLLLPQVEWGKGERGRWLWWSVLGCMVLALMQVAVIGSFGTQLTARLTSPFFDLSKSVGIPGAFQRVESVVAAIWTFSDLIVLGLLLRGLCLGTRALAPRVKEGRAALAFLLVAAVGAFLAFPDGYLAQTISRSWALWGNLVLGWAVPLVALAVLLLRRK